MDTKSMGFNAQIADKREKDIGEILRHVLPQDFVKFGMIPEIIGRVPVTVSLEALDKDTLIRILREPKNSIIKQYKKLFELDGVDLDFDEGAVEAIAEKSLARKTGARGLRAILEKSMMDLMYTVPSDETIERCVVNKETIEGTGDPEIMHRDERALPSKGTRRKLKISSETA